jgi:hypothetical protein
MGEFAMSPAKRVASYCPSVGRIQFAGASQCYIMNDWTKHGGHVRRRKQAPCIAAVKDSNCAGNGHNDCGYPVSASQCILRPARFLV